MIQSAIIFQQQNILIERIHFLNLQNRTVETAISQEQQKHKISSGSLSAGFNAWTARALPGWAVFRAHCASLYVLLVLIALGPNCCDTIEPKTAVFCCVLLCFIVAFVVALVVVVVLN